MARAIAVAAAGAPVYRWTATSFIVLADKKPVVDSWACRTMTIRLMRLTAAASANAVAAFIDSHVALQLAAAA
jgi:hypothetical protein